jgi:hypothetical protein
LVAFSFSITFGSKKIAKVQALLGRIYRNVDVRVEIEILGAQPSIDLSQWDHAVEASVSLPTGRLVVMGCTAYLPEAPRIDVSPGTYQLLSLAGGIETINTEWEPADDLYRVYLWPGESRKPQCLKRWNRIDG